MEENSNTILFYVNLIEANFLAFFTGFSIKFKTLSKTFSRVYQINRSDFLQILDLEQRQKLNEIGQQFQQNLSIKGYNCQICKQSCHNLESCNIKILPDLTKFRKNNTPLSIIKTGEVEIYAKSAEKKQLFKKFGENCILLNEEEEGSIKNQNSEQSLQDTQKDEQNSKNSLSALNQNFENSLPSLYIQNKKRSSFDKFDSIEKKSNQLDSKMLNSDNTKVNSNQFDLLVAGLSNLDQKNIKNSVKFQQKATYMDQDGFERLKIFPSFFPHNNYDVVIENFNVVNKYLQKQFRQGKKLKTNLVENSLLSPENVKRIKRKK